MKKEIITLGHGSGAGLTRKLISEIFDKNFHLPTLDDGVQIENRTVVTTDAHVVQPIFFPGGDIGKLSITGTVNDVAMTGAIPKYILITYIIEEGFKIDDLRKITESVQKAAIDAGVKIIAGDTKVVEKGKADGIYITTTGIGFLPEKVELSSQKIEVGDKIIVNGNLGDHTVAIINARQNLELDPAPKSDCASLNHLVQFMLKNGDVHFLRDATRGGVATILNEVSDDTGFGIIIDEEALPISENVEAVCGLLGLDALYMANEGKLVSFISQKDENIIDKMKTHKSGKNSAIIGEVTNEFQGVYLRTSIGGLRPLLMLESDPLPRIC
ncbi:MAG: hydrogenase expression/formation protein HypE [Candidatus Cloacimonetes bacterium]|nr:hydrogenase expression/formation protein HypE [Candidatus Cloacimonadota bacterium]MCF7814527.1 hydrogenase expression/formation protein HypE [Candidatus Cloacimonadota bacterium]MCF7867681.1 hydrogenase expression/formation protein HypE [Candidatus Cloacimonadota bacterium]MCF7883521.1 hydrogenase expression/formation protein HypE [Candidatus Cloacimonadota bacterium]